MDRPNLSPLSHVWCVMKSGYVTFAGEGVDDVNALAPQGLAKLLLQQVIDTVQDKVDHLDRGVDDAQPFSHTREGVAEKLVVQLDDDPLFALGTVDAGCALADALIELLQGIRFFGQLMLIQRI